MKIVPFQDRHLAGIDRLWRECFPDDPPRNQAAQSIPTKITLGKELGEDLILIAENASGEIVGTVMAGYDGHRGWLYAVAVDPGERRGGVGAALVEHACQRLRALGCQKVNLQIRAGNEPVTAFYRSLGFEVEPRVSMGREI